MDSLQSNFKKALVGHQCQFKPPFTTLEHIRQSAKNDCPTCHLWLACIDWAVPELAEYDDIRTISTAEMSTPKPDLSMIKLFAASTVTLVAFQLNGRFVEWFLFHVI
jgi:hypothetical protein